MIVILLEKNSKLVFIGDSITDCYRGQPCGEGLWGYGNGYVSLIDGMLKAFCYDENIRVVNMGIGGDTVRDLSNRWQKDCLDLNPDYVSVMIGVNDLWRQYDFPLVTDRHCVVSDYEEIYDALLEKTKSKVKKLILMTPFFLEPNKDEPFRKDLAVYQEITKKLAAKHDAIYIDIQSYFDEYMKHVHPMSIGALGDRVHPNTNGHFIIAKAFLEKIEAEIFK